MKSFWQAILNFFSMLFGGGKKEEDPATDPPSSDDDPDLPSTPEPEGEFWEDGGDVPTDSIVTPVLPAEIEASLAGGTEKDAEETSAAENPAIAEISPTDPVTPVVTPEGTIPRDGDTLRTPRYMWCLDNGHGEDTAGKRSPLFDNQSQFFEYEFTRDINARIMKAMDVLGLKHFNVVPEIEGDIPLRTRCARANDLQSTLPKIYLSIHANANGNGSDWNAAHGTETWFHGNSSKGKNLASSFQKFLIQRLGFADRGIRYHEPVTRAFYVLRKTNMPAVLTEIGFYTNKEEAIKLADNAWREKIAKAHIDAILEVEDKGYENIDTYPKVLKIRKG